MTTNRTRIIVIAISLAMATVGFAGPALATGGGEEEAEMSFFAKISNGVDELLVSIGLRAEPEPSAEASAETDSVRHDVTADAESGHASATVDVELRSEEVQSEIDARLAELTGETERLKAELEAKLEETQGASSSKVHELEMRIEEVQREVESLKAELELRLEEVQRSEMAEAPSLEELEQIRADVMLEIKQLENECMDIRADIVAELSASVTSSAGDDLNGLTGELNGKTGEVERLTGEVEGTTGHATGEVERLTAEVNAKVDETKATVDETKGTVEETAGQAQAESEETNVFEKLSLKISVFISGLFGSDGGEGEAHANASAEGGEAQASGSAEGHATSGCSQPESQPAAEEHTCPL